MAQAAVIQQPEHGKALKSPKAVRFNDDDGFTLGKTDTKGRTGVFPPSPKRFLKQDLLG